MTTKTYGYWEFYRGSGRLSRPIETGFASQEEAYQAMIATWGDRNPDYNPYVIGEDEEMQREFDWGVHDGFHTPDRAEWGCQFCEKAGWAS